jgi:hypothetical protein
MDEENTGGAGAEPPRLDERWVMDEDNTGSAGADSPWVDERWLTSLKSSLSWLLKCLDKGLEVWGDLCPNETQGKFFES